MGSNFSRIIVLLRQERGISQRTAAADLGISQSLLSHYENALREPGLEFLRKVCDYYNVSADFVLGRTSIRSEATLDADTLYDSSRDQNTLSVTTSLAMLDKKLLVNSLSILFDMLGKVGDETAVTAAYQYLGAAIYRMFRHLSNLSPDGKDALFEVSDLEFVFGAANADMTLNELEYVKCLRYHENAHKPFPPAGYAALKELYPNLYESLMQLIHDGGRRVTSTINAHQKHTNSNSALNSTWEPFTAPASDQTGKD